MDKDSNRETSPEATTRIQGRHNVLDQGSGREGDEKWLGSDAILEGRANKIS